MFLTVVRQRVGVIFVFLTLCECTYTCVWLCVLKTVSHRVKQRLVSDSPQHPPSTLPNLTSVLSQRFTSVASISSHQYEQIIRTLRGLSINPRHEYSFTTLPYLLSLPSSPSPSSSSSSLARSILVSISLSSFPFPSFSEEVYAPEGRKDLLPSRRERDCVCLPLRVNMCPPRVCVCVCARMMVCVCVCA